LLDYAKGINAAANHHRARRQFGADLRARHGVLRRCGNALTPWPQVVSATMNSITLFNSGMDGSCMQRKPSNRGKINVDSA